MDALRGGFGTVGSIIRARSMRKSIASGTGPMSPAVEQWRQRHPYASGGEDTPTHSQFFGMQRHQLYDKPMPRQSSISGATQDDEISLKSQPPRKTHKSIKFGDQDTRHLYPSPGVPGVTQTDSIIKSDPYADIRDSYVTTNTTAGGGSSVFSVQQDQPMPQKVVRALPNPRDPFEDPKSRDRSSNNMELDKGTDSASEEGAEEVPLTASLHKGYPRSRHVDDDREESFGLVTHPSDSVRLVQPRM